LAWLKPFSSARASALAAAVSAARGSRSRTWTQALQTRVVGDLSPGADHARGLIGEQRNVRALRDQLPLHQMGVGGVEIGGADLRQDLRHVAHAQGEVAAFALGEAEQPVSQGAGLGEVRRRPRDQEAVEVLHHRLLQGPAAFRQGCGAGAQRHVVVAEEALLDADQGAERD
jgi:hypothetical protein